MNKLHICLSTDSRWLRFAQRAVYDIIIKRNADTEIKFYVLGDKVDSETLSEAFRPFNNIPGIEAVTRSMDADAIFGGLFPYTWEWIGPFKHLKFLVPELEDFAGVDRVLHLDVDILVRKDLTDIYQIDLDGKAIGAVRDYAHIREDRYMEMFDKRNKIENGLLLMDLPELRRLNFTEQCKAEAKRHNGDLPVMEQIAVPHTKFLDPKCQIPYHFIASEERFRNIKRWNRLNGTEYTDINDLIGQSYIFHYPGDKEMFVKEIPCVRAAFELLEERLERFLSTGTVEEWRPWDDDSALVEWESEW